MPVYDPDKSKLPTRELSRRVGELSRVVMTPLYPALQSQQALLQPNRPGTGRPAPSARAESLKPLLPTRHDQARANLDGDLDHRSLAVRAGWAVTEPPSRRSDSGSVTARRRSQRTAKLVLVWQLKAPRQHARHGRRIARPSVSR